MYLVQKQHDNSALSRMRTMQSPWIKSVVQTHKSCKPMAWSQVGEHDFNHVVRTLWHQAQSALGTETSTTPWQQNNKYQALSNVICKPKESKEIADHWLVMSACHTQQCLCRIQPCRWQTALLLNASWTSGPQHLRFRFLYILACWPFNTPLGFSCSFSPPRVQSTGLNTCK